MTESKIDAMSVLSDAIEICGDCPNCGSEDWTDEGVNGKCNACGVSFEVAIPRQMVIASKALREIRSRLARHEVDAMRYRALRDSGRYAVDPFNGGGWCLGRDETAAALDAAADALVKR